MTTTEQSEDCQMPGCWRHTEAFADLCDPCAAKVADLADSIGEPRDAGALERDAQVALVDQMLEDLPTVGAVPAGVLLYLRTVRGALTED